MVIAIAHVAVGELAEADAAAAPPSAAAGASPGAGVTDAAAAADAEAALRVEPSVSTLVESLLAKRADMEARGLLQAGPERAGGQLWVGIGGAPGSGKSTLASEVAAQLCARGCPTVVIPMDGFHYSKKQLDAMPDPDLAHARRGAPFTFDAAALADTIFALKRQGAGQVPSFDHAVGDPVPGGVALERRHVVVLVEGNYLLLWDEAPWGRLRAAFDCTWFLECPEAVLRERVITRNAAAWGWDYARTAARVDANDMPNARLVASTRKHAEQVILTHPSPRASESGAAGAADGTPAVVKSAVVTPVEGMRQALFIETGFGACQKGVDATKAALRAARNAIEFNSVPAIRLLCADARSDMIVRVSIAVPAAFASQVDVEQVAAAFPHGQVSVRVQEGGGLFTSGLRQVGGQEQRDEMLVAVAHVVVGRN
jgi:uncharacterized protein (TIGR02058 family)